MAELRIETRQVPQAATRVALAGEFDLSGIERFERAIAEVESERPSAIIIDLSELEFMDSSGLRALVAANDRAQKAGRRLAIVPGAPVIRRVFEITQLDGRLELLDGDAA